MKVSIFLFAFLSGAWANAGGVYIWDNARGFVSAEGCRVEPAKTLEIEAVPDSILLDQKLHRSLKAVNGTLVRRTDDKTLHKDGESYIPLRLVAVPMQDELRGKGAYALRGDRGYLANSEIRNLKDYEIMITKPAKTREENSITTIGDSGVPLVGSVWRAPVDNKGEFSNYICGDNTYAIFQVADQQIYVGVSPNESTIFSDVDVRPIDGKEPIKKDQKNLQPAAPAQPAPQVAEAAPAEPAPQAEAPKVEFKVVPLPRPRPKNIEAKTKAKPKAKHTAPPARDYGGQTCYRGDSDTLKCMMCVIAGEANLSSQAGMVAVGRTVMQRFENRGYPHNICQIAWQSGQFVGLQPGKRIPSDRQVLARLTAAARQAIEEGGNGFLGFRTCSYSRKGVAIGGNCFREKADLEDIINGNVVKEAMGMDIDVQPPTNYVELDNGMRDL